MPADDISSEIVIRRETYAQGRGSWRVRLDGQNVGRLANGESLALRASPGSHTLVVGSAINFSGPFQFDAEAGGRIELAVQFTRAIGFWCSAASAVPRSGTDVAGTVAEEARYEVPLGDEAFVIDNSQSAAATTRVVRLTREWTRTSEVDIERATTTQRSVGIAMRVLDLKAAAEHTLNEKYSVTTGERKTFEEEVTLNVAPHTRCRVIFSWKEIRQKGVVLLASGGSQVRIPYEIAVRITFDQQQIDDEAQLCPAGHRGLPLTWLIGA